MQRLSSALVFATALVGLATVTGCADPEPEDHGTIRIEMAPLGGNTDMFIGTTEVTATVHYEPCLQEFYLDRKPTYQQDGPDGAPVFEDWAERLCSDFSDIPDCEVTEIEQSLLDVNDVYTLKVTFKINDASTLAYREVHVGPIPTEAFADCGDGQRAKVELQSSGLIGKDAQGVQLWRISTLPGSNVAIANQGAPLRVELIDPTPDP
jgi:hypothetical protein